jgi:2-polyprenyl-3-methyl-5-hydroxy-6-metoxy-1,4-benzoquinol methylase
MFSDHELNRAAWDQLAAVHGQDGYYDSDALVAGGSSLIEEEEDALLHAVGATLAGKRILHLQCHIGFDAITFARRGASVTGVDFSMVALDKARCLADRCGVKVDWVHADAVQLPASLHSRFDLVWATMGIACWIADMSAWMRAAEASLAPSGRLVLIDGHPGDIALRDSATVGAAPIRRVIDSGYDYATSTRTGPQVQFKYSLAALIAAATSARLCVNRLVEHEVVSADLCIATLKREPDGRYRSRVNGRVQPALFTLILETLQSQVAI